MSNQVRDVLDQLVRNDLSLFVHRTFQTVAPAQNYLRNWHVNAMAWHLEQCATGKIKRLLPPRNLKSICASVAFSAFLLGHDPTRRIICASYSADLASKHARDCRTVIETPWFRGHFPERSSAPRKKPK
jgi:hypothetical protein